MSEIIIPRRVKDITGQKFNLLTVISFNGSVQKGNGSDKVGTWNCLCDCGKSTIVVTAHLTGGYTKSCGCYNPRQLPSGEGSFNEVYRNYERNAKKRNHSFNLTKEQVRELVTQNCRYCNLPPSNIHKSPYISGDFTYGGIDRLDNKIGYEISNCAPCCFYCNRAKMAKSEQEYREWIKQSYEHMFK